MPYQLCVLACGTMGVAVTAGVIDNLAAQQKGGEGKNGSSGESGKEDKASSLPDRFIATVGRPQTAEKLRKTFDGLGELGKTVQVRTSGENVKSVKESDVILLCCKPYLASHLLLAPGMSEALEGKLLISILAGMTISTLKEMVPESCTVVRAMTNTPAKIREGMTVISSLPPSDPKSTDYERILSSLFTPIGACRFMDEKHFDAVTAIAGSGPAFMFTILDAIADGGVMMGLPRREAVELAAETMQGAARMVLQTGDSPATCKDSVMTPGGCTIAGILSLEEDKIRSTMAKCIKVTTLHAAGLGKK